MTTEQKIQTITDLINICWIVNGTNAIALNQLLIWLSAMIDTDPGFGDWVEPNAEPYLDDAIIWLNNFITTHNLR